MHMNFEEPVRKNMCPFDEIKAFQIDAMERIQKHIWKTMELRNLAISKGVVKKKMEGIAGKEIMKLCGKWVDMLPRCFKLEVF